MRRPLPAPTTGRGEFQLGRQAHPVSFQLHVGAHRGHVTGDPEVMADTFRRGEGRLRIEGGDEVLLTFVAHTAGGDAAYFETPKKAVEGRSPIGVALPASPRRAPS